MTSIIELQRKEYSKGLMSMRAFAVLAVLGIFILSAEIGDADHRYFVVPGEARCVPKSTEGGCCKGLIRGIQRLLKRFKKTELVLHTSDQQCYLAYDSGQWGCETSESDASSRTQPQSMAVVGDGPLMGRMKPKLSSEADQSDKVLGLYQGKHVRVRHSQQFRIFTATKNGIEYQLKLKGGSVVLGPIDSKDTVIVSDLIPRVMSESLSPLRLAFSMRTHRDDIAVFKLKPPILAGHGSHRWAVDTYDVQRSAINTYVDSESPAIALTLKFQSSGVMAIPTFVSKASRLPSRTVAVVVGTADVQLKELYKRNPFRKTQHVVLWKTGDMYVMTDLVMHPVPTSMESPQGVP